MSSVSVAEVVSKLMDKGLSEFEIREIFEALKLLILPFDEEQGLLQVYYEPTRRVWGYRWETEPV
jgi:PIN domain nuclease of toxin-antitoxin system